MTKQRFSLGKNSTNSANSRTNVKYISKNLTYLDDDSFRRFSIPKSK